MPSSTSNSEMPERAAAVASRSPVVLPPPAERAPDGPWLPLLVSAVLAATLIMTGINRIWELRGHRPTVSDSVGLWSYHRRALRRDSPQWALLGTSRMKVGFSEHVFRRRYPDQTPRMLAVAGAYPMAAVADLADDQQFRGTLILDVTSETLRAARWNDQREHVEAAHNWSPQHAMDSLIRAALQQRFTVCQAHLSLARCSRSWWERGKLPTPAPVVSSFSRFSTGQFVASPARQSSDAASHRTGRPVELEPHPHASVQLLRDAQRKLRARGGRLVLVHFPTRVVDRPSAERAQRKRHWLSLQRTTGIDSIHFSDLPGMSQLRVADGQHLNADDAKQFTDALLDAIEAMDLIPSSVADDRARSSR